MSVYDGDGFSHLSQHGYVTETEFNLLYAEAAHLAGVIFDHIGFRHYCGNYAHSESSRHLARAKKSVELLRAHIAIVD